MHYIQNGREKINAKLASESPMQTEADARLVGICN